MYAIDNYFDLSDYNVVRKLHSLNEESIFKVTGNAIKAELDKIHNILNSKNINNNFIKSTFYKSFTTYSKDNKFKDLGDKLIEFFNSILPFSDIGDDKHKFEKYIANLSYVIGIFTSASGIIYNPTNPFPVIIVGACFMSAGVIISELYDCNSNSFTKGFSKLSESPIFKFIESAAKVPADVIKKIFTIDISGKASISENYNPDTILEEVAFLEFSIVNNILDFIVNLIRIPVYIFFNIRVSIDNYLNLIIYLLEDNVNNNKSLGTKVKKRQEKWLVAFKKMSQIVAVDFKRSNTNASKELNVKPKYNEVVTNRSVEFDF